MNKEDMIKQAKETANSHGLDLALFCALCEHESSWNTWAIRYEPAFEQRYLLGKGFPSTETKMRSTSFGLGQIMGQTARELGFDGKYITELCDPAVGLEYAARKFKRCVNLSLGDNRKALLCYNGGGDDRYPDMVLPLVASYRG